MNVMRFTSMGLGSVVMATLMIAGCDNKKSGSQTTADDASATSPAESAAPSAAPSASAPSASAESSDSDDEKLAAEEVLDHHRYHHGGITTFIAMSLDTLGVSTERQAAVQKIQHELDTRMAPVHDAERKLLDQLADGVAGGAVDGPKAEAELGHVARAVGAVRSAGAELINQLHTTLSPVERAALVDKVQAHWQVWRNANAEEAPDAGGRGHGEQEGGRLAKLTRELELTPDQVEKIQTGLKAKAGGVSGPIEPKLASDVEARLATFSTAFAGESFDAKTLSAWEADDSHLVTAGATRMVHLCEVAAPVLTPEQRTKFAVHLREHRIEPAGK